MAWSTPAGGRGGRNTFEHKLKRLHIVQKNAGLIG